MDEMRQIKKKIYHIPKEELMTYVPYEEMIKAMPKPKPDAAPKTGGGASQIGGGNLINADNSQYSGGFGSNMGAVAGCVGCDGCGGQKGGGHSKIEAQNQMGPAGYGVHNLTRVDNISMQGSGYPVISAFNSAKQCFGGNKKVRKARKSRRKARRKARKSRKSRRKARRKKRTTKKN